MPIDFSLTSPDAFSNVNEHSEPLILVLYVFFKLLERKNVFSFWLKGIKAHLRNGRFPKFYRLNTFFQFKHGAGNINFFL